MSPLNTPPSLEINATFKKALRLMEGSSRPLFITGKAGTGKSTLLTYFRDHTQKSLAVLAPTGVAAVNIQGQTIHSFFKFKPDVTVDSVKKKRRKSTTQKTIYQKLQTLIIDEISMVRADLLDCIDRFLRLNGPDENQPFGGIQMIFFGDLYQLSPVVSQKDASIFETYYESSYFFSARVFKELDLSLIELEKIYRQKDQGFIEILNAIRNDTVTQGQLDSLNTRHDPTVSPSTDTFSVFLTPTNKAAQALNETQLSHIDGKYHLFEGTSKGRFDEKNFPAPQDLQLKIGAQVMLLNNDPKKRWINGTMGRVRRIFQDDEDYETLIRVELDNGRTVNLSPYTWEIYTYKVKEEKITSEVAGSFTQYPMTLAWAMTIHKSQGKTFEQAIIDLGKRVFSPGQTYVALSRCRSLEGVTLRQKILRSHVWIDQKVTEFLTHCYYKDANKKVSVNEKLYVLGQALENQEPLQITYLQTNGRKSLRTIEPLEVGEMTYQGEPYQGVKAYCQLAEKNMTFTVSQILEIHYS